MGARAIQQIATLLFAICTYGFFQTWWRISEFREGVDQGKTAFAQGWLEEKIAFLQPHLQERATFLWAMLACLVVYALAEFAYQYGKRGK